MKTATFRSLLALATLLTGSAIYGLSSLPAASTAIVSLESHSESIASIVSSYAFTIGGFLATIATFLFALADRPYFQFYKRRGSFGDLMFFHGLVLLVLCLLFVLSLFLLSWPCLLRVILALTGLSVLQLVVLTYISYNLTHRSQES